MAGPRILTFNFHEPYLCLMARTGLHFTVGQYASGGLARTWHTQFRPIPPNMTLLEENVWRPDLAAGRFDLVIAHNETNAADVCGGDTPSLLVCHNRRTFLETTLTGGQGQTKEDFARLLDTLRKRFHFVFISESKKESYGLPGRVILPGIDIEDYGGYRGETAEVLRVGNAMRARNLMFDVDFQEAACRGLPNRVLGSDPLIPGATPSRSFEDLVETYRSLRCYLHVTREDWEDGYNLAMLEAMATGMPVAALANRTSPLRDGVDGFVSPDAAVLREHLAHLLEDPEEARKIGEQGRQRVAEVFPIAAFTDRWSEAIDEAAQRASFSAGVPKAAQSGGRKRILMEYMADPITTARYLEEALREEHEVVTVGPRLPEAVLEDWGFEGEIPAYAPHTIDHDGSAGYPEIVKRFPAGFEPGLFLFVDSARQALGGGLDSLTCPKACYLIDTHMDADLRLQIARHFHATFLAQKGQVQLFRQAGIPSVHWLPLACSPALHDIGERERDYDVAYVGGLVDERRKTLLGRVAERFPNSKIGRAWPHDMAQTYARAKIVVNACINRDVNMRVFEAMASGALLITDEAEGLEDLFEDRKHLVVYRSDEDLFGLVEHYLADHEARNRIARAGRELVLSEHTYIHRVKHLMAVVSQANVTTEADAYYQLSRPELAMQVPAGAKRVLDVGCGAGALGRLLKERGVPEVVGIETVEHAWADARQALDDVLLGSIEDMDLPFEDGYFDCVICGDVLEHLVDPAAALRKLARVLAPDGLMVISIPNVRYAHVVDMLVHGRWKYEDAGILDRTHLRFYTKTELPGLIHDAGLRLLRLEPLTMLPPEDLPLGPDRSLKLGRMTLEGVSEAEYEEFRVYQYLLIAARPEMDALENAARALETEDYETAYALAEKAPDLDEVRRLRIMATAALHLGLLDKAEGHYCDALKAEPANAEVKGELGILLVGMNRPAMGRPLLEEARAADPGDYKVAGALGLAYLAEGRREEAFTQLKTAVELNFENEELLNHLVETAHGLGRLAEVEEPLKRFAGFFPGNTGMAFSYAAVLRELGKTSEAREQLETLLLLSPGHERATALLAELDDEDRPQT